MPAAYAPDLLSRLLPIIAKAGPRLLASGTFYVAESASVGLIGAGGWTFERPGTDEVEPGLGHIRHVAVDPAWTGRGIGRALVEHVFAMARAASVERFECYASLNAVDFYARLGFKEVGPIDIAMDGDVVMPSLLMERAL